FERTHRFDGGHGTRLALEIRQELDLVLEVLRGTARHGQLKSIDGLANVQILTAHDHPGHRESGPNSVPGVTDHRVHVLGDDHPAFPSGPLQNIRVRGAPQPHVLDADKVEVWHPALQSANNGPVEVLVTCERKHVPAPAARGGPATWRAAPYGPAGSRS